MGDVGKSMSYRRRREKRHQLHHQDLWKIEAFIERNDSLHRNTHGERKRERKSGGERKNEMMIHPFRVHKSKLCTMSISTLTWGYPSYEPCLPHYQFFISNYTIESDSDAYDKSLKTIRDTFWLEETLSIFL